MPEEISKSSEKIRRIDPKLRMYASCDEYVNIIRSEFKGNMAVAKSMKLPDVVKRLENTDEIPAFTKGYEKKPRVNDPENILVNVFVELTLSSSLKIKGERYRKGNIVSAEMSLTDLNSFANSKELDQVLFVEPGKYLSPPTPTITDWYASAPNPVNLDNEGDNTPKVLIGIIDVGGFDFSHPDFLDKNGDTRFVKIWDQGGTFRKSPKKPFNYGAEFDKDHLDAAIKESLRVGVPPTLLERQSQMNIGSHGTHVASIAAGNSGVCPNSLIAGVLISLNGDDLDRRKSFYDSMSVAHAVDYLVRLANELGLPLSINISLGTNGHAHDGSDVLSRWVDAELLKPGVSVCVAAGNSGQEAPVTENDFGFVMGRIHTSGTIKSQGLSEDIRWKVVGNGIADISENELEIWYDSQDDFSVEIKPPGMNWIGPVRANQYMQNVQLPDGSFLSIYSEQYHPSNGLNYIGIYLTPGIFENKPIIPIRAGTWLVRLRGENIRNGSYHGWIERDDPRRRGAIGERQNWNFPSFFDETSNVDNTSISSLACAHYVIAVANIDTENDKVNISSSQGPTRDGRHKPEIGAAGTNIVAAKGFSPDPSDLWIAKTGTSMASPYVCGVVGNMLQVNPVLTAAQISGILKRTSTPLPGGDYTWKNDLGYGLVNPIACIKEADSIKNKVEVK